MSTSKRNPVRSATRSASDSEDQPPGIPTTPILSAPPTVRGAPAASVVRSAKQHLSRKAKPLWMFVDLRDHDLQYVAALQKHLSDERLVQYKPHARRVRSSHAKGQPQRKSPIADAGGVLARPIVEALYHPVYMAP